MNNRRITESPLIPGDVLRLGRCTLDVVSGAAALRLLVPLTCSTEGTASVELVEPESETATREGQLTPAQHQVLRLLLEGLAEKEVAEVLIISPQTVHTHAKHIYRQFGVHSRSELMALYISRGEEDA